MIKRAVSWGQVTQRLMIFGMVVGILFGCSDDPDGNSSELPYAGHTLMILEQGTHTDALRKVARQFEAETGATVIQEAVGFPELAEMGATTGAGYDIVMLSYASLGYVASKGQLLELDAWWSTVNAELELDSDIIPNLLVPYTTYNGKKYAVPFDGDVHVLYYNKSMLEEVGFVDDSGDAKPPATWDEYLQIVEAVQASAGENFGAMIWGSPIPLLGVSNYTNRLFSFGGRLFKPDGTPDITSAQAVAALTTMIESSEYLYIDGEFFDAQDRWKAGTIAMYESWPDLGIDAELGSQDENAIKGNWGVTMMPVGGDNTEPVAALNAGYSLGVGANSEEQELALEFLKFSLKPEVRMSVITDGDLAMDPIRVSIVQSEKFHNHKPNGEAEIIEKSLMNGVAWSNGPKQWEAYSILSQNISDALTAYAEETNTKTAAELAQETLEATLLEWNAVLAP